MTDPRETPGARHPLVRVHPVTGRKCLFLGRRRNAYILGLAVAESEALLDALWEHCRQPHLAWYQVWRTDDLIVWDNRCTMHRRDPFSESSRRVMHRTQMTGEPVLSVAEKTTPTFSLNLSFAVPPVPLYKSNLFPPNSAARVKLQCRAAASKAERGQWRKRLEAGNHRVSQFI